MCELRNGYLKNNKTHSTLYLHVWKVSAPRKGQAQDPLTLRIPCLSSLPFCYWKESLFNSPTHQVTRQLFSKVSPKLFSLNYRRQSSKLYHSESSVWSSKNCILDEKWSSQRHYPYLIWSRYQNWYISIDHSCSYKVVYTRKQFLIKFLPIWYM